jgi:uncharacterized tellurite resistance protein B-like protein
MWLDALTEPQRVALFALAHDVIVSDGLLDPNEEAMMERLRREMGLPADVQSQYIELDGIAGVFDSPRARRIALVNLIHLSYVDGALEIEEECVLRELADAFGVAEDEFTLLENWVKRLRALEEEGKGLL